jgi:sterol 3beta-glucosyltransferase
MKITILTAGSRGDVQPFVALALGLQRAGHRVTLAAPLDAERFVAGYGVSYARLTADYQQLAATEQSRAALGGNPAALFKTYREFQGMMRTLLDDAWAAAQGADTIVYHPKALAGADIARRLTVPGFLAAPMPMLTPTAAFPMPGTFSRNLGGKFNRATYAANRLMLLSFYGLINRWRRETLGLPPRSPLAHPFSDNGRPLPQLYAVSPQVVPRPDDWPAHAHMTGYWFLPAVADWSSPPALEAFLAAGEPPVYVGFGSMAGRKPEETTALVLEALAQSGQRGILASGWGGLRATALPEHVHLLEAAPHAWLFPRCAAVVHHGGAGTTAAGLQAGRPTIICPFFGDQPFWGQRVAASGAGPAPIPQKKLTAAGLAAAIREATRNAAMRQRAAAIGAAIRAEDGVQRAVELIEAGQRE